MSNQFGFVSEDTFTEKMDTMNGWLEKIASNNSGSSSGNSFDFVKYVEDGSNISELLENASEATKICQGAFAFVNIRNVNMPNVTSVGEHAFDSATVQTVTFPAVNDIGMDAFNYCTNLTSISLPSVNSIYAYAFANCYALETLTLESNIGTISEGAFEYCTSLKSVAIKNITTLYYNTFNACESLEKVDFGNISMLNANAFNECTNLNTLIIRNSYTVPYPTGTTRKLTLGSNVPSDISIYVHSSMVDAFKSDSYWVNYVDNIKSIEDYPDICGTTE